MAIVGSRRGTPYGLRMAERLGGDLGGRGVTVVSGLARGVDTAAHRGALDAGGRTLAVLGSGVDVVYPPENRGLAAEVVKAGAVVSQFPMGTAPLPYHFPARNRVIAGLTLGTVVVEAAERSGALITARLAGELGREVYAVPGNVSSAGSQGTNSLIQDGAKLVQGWEDVVAEWPREWRQALRPLPARGPATEPGRRGARTSPESGRSSRCWETSRSRSTRWWSGAGSRRARCRQASWPSSSAGSYAGSPDSGTSGARGGSVAGRTSLVVVESPTKVKTIQKYLDRGYVVKASLGHLKDLPKSKLGIDIKKGFTPQYVPVRTKPKTLDELKRAGKKAKALYIATDPDREGEAIGWHIAQELGLPPERVFRVLFNEITEKAVKAAFKDPGGSTRSGCDAQQARRVLDRLVGYKISPLLWERVRRGLSAGRVQSVAVRLICEREREIRAFVPQEYWSLHAYLAAAAAARVRRHAPGEGRREDRPVHRGRDPGHHRRAGARDVRGQDGRPGRAAEEPVAALHHLDPPAGRGAEAPLLGVQDHDGRPAALRGGRHRRGRGGRPHHVHADRLAPGGRRGADGGPRRDRGPVRRGDPARPAAVLPRPQVGPGGPRGDPALAPRSAARAPGPPSEPGSARALPADLGAVPGEPDARRALRHADGRRHGRAVPLPGPRLPASLAGLHGRLHRGARRVRGAGGAGGRRGRGVRDAAPRGGPASRPGARSIRSSTSPSRRPATPRPPW